MSTVQDAIAAVRNGSSPYWAFYDPQKGEGDRAVVEVRLADIHSGEMGAPFKDTA
jgi:hypothetical protein